MSIPLTLRTIKGSKLTFNELDSNFLALRNAINSAVASDTFVTGGTYNPATVELDFTGVAGFNPFSVDVSALKDDTNTFVTGVTYTQSASTLTLTRNDGVSLSTTIVSSGGGDSYWTAGTAGNFSVAQITDTSTDATGDYSVAFGVNTLASGGTSFVTGTNSIVRGTNSSAHGDGNSVTGSNSFATGGKNIVSGDYSTASGYYTTASGNYSTASGNYSTASGNYSTASGYESVASGLFSTASGNYSTASGRSSHAEGDNSTASGDYSHAEGNGSTASGTYSHAEGQGNVASGSASHVEGGDNTASGDYSHAEGSENTASGNYSHVEGIGSTASGNYSHAEGQQTQATGTTAHAEGNLTNAFGDNSHSEGFMTIADGTSSHAEGDQTRASGLSSHAEGKATAAIGNHSHTEGSSTTASGFASHAEGQGSTASGLSSHAEGGSTASGNVSHAEGNQTQASGVYSHSEGFQTQATGATSHAEGQQTVASGDISHAEGYFSTASGYVSHAEGGSTTASGVYSHAEGAGTTASAYGSHAQNEQNTASGINSHAGGFSSTVSGQQSFIHSTNSLLTGNRSVLLGGQNLTGTTNDTVYVPYLNINNLGTGTSINNLGIDSNGFVVVGATGTFTGNTSGDCITDLYVTNLHSCSPLNINPLDEGNVYFGSTSGITIDLSNNRVGIGESNPDRRLVVSGSKATLYVDTDEQDPLAAIIPGNRIFFEGNPSGSTRMVFGTETNVGVTIGQLGSLADSGNLILGNPLDTFIYSNNQANNLNIITQSGSGTDDNIRFYAGSTAVSTGTLLSGITSAMHIQGSGPTKGYIGINNENPQFTLDVVGETRLSGSGQNVLTVIGSGATQPLFTVQGSEGELFSITDSLKGSLFSVNDISGLPILEVFDNDTVHMGSYQAPSLNTTVLLNPGTGLSTVYSLPVSAYTGAWFDYTVSNTTGARAGNIMSIFSGSSVNFTETTTTDIGSTTPITFTMSSDGSNASLQVSAATTGWEVKTIVRSI